ncbi:hypothetical protein I4U23_017351 [Adineta vaga]|nr:hypothetical protein I4U23_017351 [Adineta vaga]
MFLTTILVLFIIFLTTAYWYLNSQYKTRNNKLRGLKPEWFFGNLRNTGILSGRVTFHEAFVELKEKYGDVFSFWLGSYHGIVLSRLDHVQQVLADRQTYDVAETTTRNFGVLFPTGLIALRGSDWKRHARFMLPMFKRAKVLPYFDTIITCTDRFIDERLAPQNGQIRTDLVEQSQRFLLNIIAFIAFDYDLEASASPGVFDLRDAFNDFVHVANQFILMNGIPMWIGKLILKMSRKYQRALRTMKHYVMSMIIKEQSRQQQAISSDKPKNLIASLVAAGKTESSTQEASLSSNEIFDEVLLSTLAGFETTSTALSWFIFYMTKYPEIQQKIKDELKEHHLTHDIAPTQDMLDSLIYVDCVVKEVLRYAPITGAIGRQATRDSIIDDIEIKKGDIVMLAAQNLHRDPRYWNVDPSQFIPERFLHEDKYPPSCVLLTFGGGHRACAGQDLALLEFKAIVIRLMQRVTFLDPGKDADNSGGMVQRITCFPKHLAVRVALD